MSKYKIVITDYYYNNIDKELKIFTELGNDVEILDLTKVETGGIKEPNKLIEYVSDADAVIVQFAEINAKVIDAMKKCKVIARYAIGVDVIDVDAATNKGIYVANVPDYCLNEVANTAIAHMLNAVRKISLSRDRLLNKCFDLSEIRPMMRIEEATLCLLGFGNISRNVYNKMKYFFKRIVVYDPYVQNDDAYSDVEFMMFEDAISEGDVISVHIPLNDETKKLIDAGAFSKMKDGVIFINTARGSVIDEDALIKALKIGKIGFAGLDVITMEDFENSELLKMDNVSLTPHIGWCSEEAAAELQVKVAKNVVSTLKSGTPIYKVNEV